MLTKNIVYLESVTINSNQGLLKSFDEVVCGAFNLDAKAYWLKEGLHPTEVSLPDPIKDYNYKGEAGHFAIYRWDFSIDTEVSV